MEQTQEIISNELDDIINQLSWVQFKTLIFNFNSLKESVSKGGVRIIKKNRRRLHPSIKKECLEDNKYLSGLFSLWFNDQKEYADCLSEFFKSEKHQGLLEERDLNSSEYAINEKYFDLFINIIRHDDIDKFLLLSPVCFTSTQKEQLEQRRKQKKDNADTPSQKSNIELSSQVNKTDAIKLTKGEWKYHKKELKKCQKIIEDLKSENIKLTNRQKKHNAEKADLKCIIDQVKADCSEETIRLVAQKKDAIKRAGTTNFEAIDRLVAQKKDMQQKIATMTKEIHDFSYRLKKKEDRVRLLENKNDRLKKEKQIYFSQILAKLDVEELISSLNAPDEVIDMLDTFIRPAVTDDDSKSAEVTLSFRSFWNGLSIRENEIIKEALDIKVKDVANRQYFRDWDSRKDDFVDLKCSLSTRIYLTDMLFRILQQYFHKDEKFVANC